MFCTGFPFVVQETEAERKAKLSERSASACDPHTHTPTHAHTHTHARTHAYAKKENKPKQIQTAGEKMRKMNWNGVDRPDTVNTGCIHIS